MIEVTEEDGAYLSGLGVERCCFCREPTTTWFTAKDVACCEMCALEALPEDVPGKTVWCRREEITRRSRSL